MLHGDKRTGGHAEKKIHVQSEKRLKGTNKFKEKKPKTVRQRLWGARCDRDRKINVGQKMCFQYNYTEGIRQEKETKHIFVNMFLKFLQ